MWRVLPDRSVYYAGCVIYYVYDAGCGVYYLSAAAHSQALAYVIIMACSGLVLYFFFFITLEPRVEGHNNL